MPVSSYKSRRTVSETAHRARHKSGWHTVYWSLLACLFGVAGVAIGLTEHPADPAAVVIGALVFAGGIAVFVRSGPASGRWVSSHAEVRTTPEGIVLEGETSDQTVPWGQFEALRARRRGAAIDVFLELKHGRQIPVTALFRRNLLTERARQRALEQLQQLDAQLRAEQRKVVHKPT